MLTCIYMCIMSACWRSFTRAGQPVTGASLCECCMVEDGAEWTWPLSFEAVAATRFKR